MKPPTGTGPLGQSGISPSSTVKQSCQREFEATVPRDELADPRQYVMGDVERDVTPDANALFLTSAFILVVGFIAGFIFGRTL